MHKRKIYDDVIGGQGINVDARITYFLRFVDDPVSSHEFREEINVGPINDFPIDHLVEVTVADALEDRACGCECLDGFSVGRLKKTVLKRPTGLGSASIRGMMSSVR